MKKIAFSISIIIFILFGCLDNQNKQFMDTAKNLKILLLELQNINVPEDIRRSEDGGVVGILNFNSKVAFVEKRKGDFKRIADSLEDFSTKNMDSKWSDDADFLRVVVYFSISFPGNNMHQEAVRSIKFFLDKYPTFKIERWTKRYFKDITLFNLFDKDKIAFDFSPYSELSELPENERIRAFFEFHTVFEYLKGDDIVSAEKEYERIKSTGKYRFLDETLRNVIDKYKKKQYRTK